MAYIVTAVFLALTGTFFTTYLAGVGYADTSIRGFVNAARFLVLLFAAVLTMRLVSAEKKAGTWEAQLTIPGRDVEIVVAKFLGALAMLSAMLVLTLYYPIMLKGVRRPRHRADGDQLPGTVPARRRLPGGGGVRLVDHRQPDRVRGGGRRGWAIRAPQATVLGR